MKNTFCLHYSYFQEYLKNIKFNYKNELVLFDANGDPPGHYDIMNFQQVGNNSMEYVAVGTWNNGTLNLHRKGEKISTENIFVVKKLAV